MAGHPIEILVDPKVKPVACHTTATIPLHWQQKIHDNLLRDKAIGILEKVSHGETTEKPSNAIASSPAPRGAFRGWAPKITACVAPPPQARFVLQRK